MFPVIKKGTICISKSTLVCQLKEAKEKRKPCSMYKLE